MQIDELVPPPIMTGYPVSQPDDPYVADLLQLADDRFVLFSCDLSCITCGVCDLFRKAQIVTVWLFCPS